MITTRRTGRRVAGRFLALVIRECAVMAGHSRSKNGVASLAYVTQVGFIRLANL
jgi:hypothetical protein